MSESDTLRRLLGILVGAVIGVIFHLLATADGYHVIGAPGVALALITGYFAKKRRVEWGAITAVLAVILCFVLEAWRVANAEEESFFYYFTQLGELSQRDWMNYGAALLAGFWFGMGKTRRRRAPDEYQRRS